MATKAPAKKAASKKAPAKKAPAAKSTEIDDIDALAAEIDADVGKAHEFEAGEAAGNGNGHGGIDYMGKRVSVTDESGEAVEGVVVKVDLDKGQVNVEAEHAMYEEVAISGLTLLDEAPAEPAAPAKPATKGKGAKAPKAEAAPEAPAGGEVVPDDQRIRTLPIDLVKIPAKKAREFAEDEKFKLMMQDLKERKQRDPIKVWPSFEKPVLTDGLRRINALKQLGFTEVRAILDIGDIESDTARIWNGLLDNEQRQNMHWLELARAFAAVTKDGEITQRKVAKSLGMSETEVSRMIGTVTKLPKKALDFAKNDRAYSWSTFAELADVAGDAEPVVSQVLTYMEEGKGVTYRDVRALKKEFDAEKKRAEKAAAKAEEKGDEGEGEEDGRSAANRPAPSGATYRGLPSSETGPKLKVVVHKDHIEFKVNVEWGRKTMTGIEVMKEIKGVFDENFKDSETSLDSFEALAKSMTAARAELG